MSSPDEQLVTMLENLAARSGKPLADWLAIIRAEGLDRHGQIVGFLKSRHRVTHGYANLIANKALEADVPTDQVSEQYSGARAGLKPIYDAILSFAQSLGSDVEVAPKKTSVSLRRKKQFALITPASNSRIDLGLALKGVEPTNRLELYNAMCSHRVRLETRSDFDIEVQHWMADAYARSG